MRIGISVGFGGGKPAPGSLAAFTSGPTISEVFDTWELVGGQERVTVIQMPRCDQPICVGGNETIIVEG